ncbi:hypothetical protein QJS10_CPA16g01315 [Acorus calamus]|uniref:Uncharacterized protein n=1 Tax=Acorus calamus TaxID=4465 RepID=A0AAV9D1V4_ACOCL|nr:hypothetical protein QJS10_CPA16g01315 [Acorus calamus]
MSPLVSASPLGTFDFPFKTLIRSDAAFGFPRVRSKRPCSIKSDIRFVCASSKPSPSENSDEIGADEVRAPVFEKWEVPWDWKTTLYVLLPYLMSIFLTGFVKSAGFTGGMLSQSGDAQTHLSVDEIAIRLFVDQLEIIPKMEIQNHPLDQKQFE